MNRAGETTGQGVTHLGWVLWVTFLASLGTGVFWHGLSFIAKHTYGFGQTRNLLLYALMGAVYAVGAFGAGAVTRRLRRLMSPRGLLAWAIALQAAVCALPVTTTSEWALWVAAGAVSMLASLTWPIIESFVTAGRHGPRMRSAIGWFNMTWMPATVVPMFVMAPILQNHGEWAIGGLVVVNLVAVGALIFFPSYPAEHDAAIAAAHVTDSYPHLLRSVRVLLPFSYVLTSVVTPLLPYRFAQLGVVDVEWETPCTATWMIVRIAALVVMWWVPFWHGRWGTLLLGALAMAGGFAVIVLAGSLPLLLLGFGGMGVGLGVIYNAALYYAMSTGGAAVEAGGTHEALIGAGYAVGPLIGLAGTALGGGAVVVGFVLALMAVSAVPAVLPYLASGGRRKSIDWIPSENDSEETSRKGPDH